MTARGKAAVANGRAKGAARARLNSTRAGARQGSMARASTGPRRGLDAEALKWLKLINDPCYGQLTHPVYPGAEGGMIARFESEVTLFSGGADTGGIVAFIPGAMPNSVYAASSLTDTTPITLANLSGANAPGYNFMINSASAIRCVSACMQVAWPGSELNRQGFVALGQVTGGTIAEIATGYGGATGSVSDYRPMCHLRTRIPETMAEVKWQPTIEDANFTDPYFTTGTGRFNACGAMMLAVSNLPTSTGVRVRFVTTYEWQPKRNQGLTASADSRSHSSNSMDDVINALDRSGQDWAYNVGRATSVFGAMVAGYTTGRRAQLIG